MCVRSWECLNSSCAACLCTGMCSSLKPTDNLTWFPAESRAVLRAGCLLCLFCGFGYFFSPLLIASNLFIQECCGISKPVPENWSASTSSFQASSWEGSSRQLSYPSVLPLQQQMLLSLLCVSREGCWPRQGKGSVCGEEAVVFFWCPEEVLWGRNQFSLKKREFGGCSFGGAGLFKRSKRIWRVSSAAVRGWVDSLCKLLGKGGGRDVKEYGEYRKFFRIQKIHGILESHFQLFARSLNSYYKTCFLLHSFFSL